MTDSLLDLWTQEGNFRTRQNIDDLIKTPVILFRARTRQWFNLFPDEIMIDLHHVVLSYNIFFNSRKVLSIPISALTTASCSYTLFYGTLNLEIFGEINHPDPIEFLSRKDAITAERLINGLIICNKQKVDLTPYPTQQIVRKLQEIGHL